MERRYRVLRTIGSIYKVLGIIVGVLTLLSILGFCATSLLGFGSAALGSDVRGLLGGAGGPAGAIVVTFFALLYGGGLAVTMYAFGEGIALFIALEENTRKTTALLERQAAKAP